MSVSVRRWLTATMPSFARYVVVGSLGLVVHLTILEALLAAGLRPAVLASVIGFLAACVVHFTLQQVWVFNSTRRVADALPRYAVVTLGMLCGNAAIFALLYGPIGLPPVVAQTLTTGCVFVLTFLCNRRFTFADASPHARRHQEWAPK